MFEGLLKGKFYSKSKSAIKMTNTRLQIIKRTRNAMQKHLKNDITDLLKNGLDANAYGRIEGLWNELNLSSCYDYVEQFCKDISSHLATMNKQRECPEDCREAVSSLMVAAARFADLPELRKLRAVFTERFGQSIECFVHKEFARRLKSASPSKEMKLQLMQDIALESGIEWNSKALEQGLYKPPDSKPSGNTGESNIPKVDGSELTATSDEPEDVDPIQGIQVGRLNRKKQEHEPPKTVRSGSVEEEQDNKKSFSYKSIPPPYTKSSKMDLDSAPRDSTAIEGPESQTTSPLNDKEADIDRDDSIGKRRRVPRSVGRRNLNSQMGQGWKVLNEKNHDVPDKEERMMDRLLLHYSKKKLPNDMEETVRDGPPTRTSSLSVESKYAEAPKTQARASSFNPAMLHANGHVHPKLPDYDDFVARLAALRGS